MVKEKGDQGKERIILASLVGGRICGIMYLNMEDADDLEGVPGEVAKGCSNEPAIGGYPKSLVCRPQAEGC